MGYTDRVIIFAFWGRQENIELQLPFIRRILEEHPNVEFHAWNFAGDCGIGGGRKNSDRVFIQSIEGPQITVINNVKPMAHNKAYRHYTRPEYRDCLFVKIDDDVVFLETARFGAFLSAVDKYRGEAAISANIVHNGACAPLQPKIWDGFLGMNVPLLEVHEYSEFAEIAHTYFFKHWREMVGQPIELIPTEDWLSINIIGYDWPMLCRMVKTIGSPHPEYLAGRPMHVGDKWPFGRTFGDEGVFQAMPRIIMKGFTAAHLTYGPQRANDEQLARWRSAYRTVGQVYLNSAAAQCDDPIDGLPELSAVSCGGPRNPT